MKNVFQFLFALFFVVSISSCEKDGPAGPDPEPEPEPEPGTTQVDIASVDKKISDFLNAYKVTGASLAVSKNGKLVYKKGYGLANTSTKEAVTPDHIFRLASISKTFTGAAVMKLVQDGKLQLDAKVFGDGGVLGTTYGKQPYNDNLKKITVRQLLNNTTGSWGPNTGGEVIDQNPTMSNSEFLNWVVNTRTNPKEPGSVYDYSNVNFFIAGRVIEKISGKSYVQYLKEDLLKPIGVTKIDMAGKTAAEKKPKEVAYYGLGGTAGYEYVIGFPRRDADGGLIASAPDLLKFVLSIDGFDSRPDILNAASLAELIKGSSALDSYGLGIGTWQSEKLWFNYGMLPGTRTGFMRGDNGMGIVLLLNTSPDYTASDGGNAFILAKQSLMVDLLKGTSYKWQNIDQF